ncbi:MAG: hypothetical protein ACLQGP_33905 [Isosphaeraceae bacterium]
MGQTYNPRLRHALMAVVENQLRDGNPPETSETLARLMAKGYPREKAMDLIACVVCTEIFDVFRRNQLYDQSRYIAGLRRLPRLPWEGREASDTSKAPPIPHRDPAKAAELRQKKGGPR